MRKSQFLGITILNPGEGLDSDNYAFTGRDREMIDYGVRVGAKLHRHNALDGMVDPVLAPSGVEVVASGGQIPTGATISVGYTFEDGQGGETRLSPTVAVTTGQPMSVPTIAPTAVVDFASGSLTVDTYYYAVSWLDGEGGETPVGPTAAADRQPGFPNAAVHLTNLNAGLAAASGSGYRLYRAVGGGAYELMAELAASASTFVDDGTKAVNCDVHPVTDSTNTTRQNNTLRAKLPAKPAAADTEPVFINLYASLGNDFAESSLLGQYPIASAGATVSFQKLEFLPLSPPDVNTSWGGANKIDPDTELIDWHWKRPVDKKSELPDESEGSEEGDVRVVKANKAAYMFIEGLWEPWTGVASGISAVLQPGGHGGGEYSITEEWEGTEVAHPPWNVSGGEAENPNTYFTVSGGKLQNSTGCPVYRKDAIGEDCVMFIKMNKEESAYFQVGAILESYTNRPSRLNAGMFGNELRIHLEVNEGSSPYLASVSHALTPNTDYWLKFTKTGLLVKIELYDEDPEVGSPTPLEELEVELDPEDAEQALFTGATSPGIMYVGAPGGYVEYIKMTGEGEPFGQVEDAEKLEFVGGSGLDVSVVEPEPGKARVIFDEPHAVKSVKCGEDLTKPRPDAEVVLWFTEGKGEEEPENMLIGDVLFATP